MSKKSKDFEILVKKLEELLKNYDDVKITHDAQIPDKTSKTGSTRQVDVWIEAKVGSHSIRILVECRNRNRVEDTTWVEQVATKRNDVGAHKAVMVSSSGFSAGAQEKADYHDISLRRVDQLDLPELAGWIIGETVICRRTFKVIDLEIQIAETYKPQHNLIFSKIQEAINYPYNKYLVHIPTGNLNSLHDILHEAVWTDEVTEILDKENPAIFQVKLTTNENQPSHHLINQQICILSTIKYEVAQTLISFLPNITIHYLEDETKLLELIECESLVDDKKFTFRLSYNPHAETTEHKLQIDRTIFDINGDDGFSLKILTKRTPKNL